MRQVEYICITCVGPAQPPSRGALADCNSGCSACPCCAGACPAHHNAAVLVQARSGTAHPGVRFPCPLARVPRLAAHSSCCAACAAQGASQLDADLSAVSAVFGEYTSRPAAHFKESREACRLLGLPCADALGLLGELDSVPREAKQVLAPHGVKSLNAEQAGVVLCQRLDVLAARAGGGAVAAAAAAQAVAVAHAEQAAAVAHAEQAVPVATAGMPV